MQGYSYSIFSLAAIVIHLVFNFKLLFGGGADTLNARRYRGFLAGVLAYYVFDGAWGILAGLGWSAMLSAETVFFFLSLVAFVVMWGRFVVVYLDMGRWPTRIISWYGHALLAFNVVALALNPFNRCMFHIDAAGVYHTGCMRDVAFYLLVASILLTAVFVLAKAVSGRGSARRRSMMVFVFCAAAAVAIVLQVVWPLTPVTSLGCLVGICFLQVFVVQDEQTARHMEELEMALARARAAEKARSLFFSIVSHDIRTPLNAILGYAELLQDSLKNEAERAEALKSIRASGTTLLQLVNDVLDLAKMDAGKMVLRPEPVRLGRLADDVFSSFHMIAGGKGVELVNKAAGVPAVLLDEHRFRQILFNLVGNAVKFTEKGSITIAAAYDGSNLEVSISDTGCGIAPEMLTKILDPFVQVLDPRHSADRLGGTGLGLSICRRIVELMGGELVVESKVGEGSTFRIVIPDVAPAKDSAGEPAGNKPSIDGRTLPGHVLVVDDSPVNRTVLTAHLRRAKIAAVDQASDGVEALAKLDSAVKEGKAYDFVFSDYWMPNMNGLELVEKIRSDPRLGRTPVFAVTADTEFRGDPRSTLFTGVLLKPLTYDKLVETMCDGMSRAAAGAQPHMPQKNVPRRVLVVDDSMINRESLVSLLESAGVVSVGQASDGEEALMELQIAEKAGRPYDFVFADLWMPNMNGMELAEKLHADSRFRNLPVYVVTADAAFRHGKKNDLFTGTIFKPVTYAKIVEAFAAR